MSTEVLGSLSFDTTPDVAGSPPVLSDSTVPSITAGITSARPAAGTVGRIYVDTTQLGLFRDDGSAWDSLTQLITLTNVANQTAITQATSSTSAIIGLANDIVIPGNAGFTMPSGTTAQRPGSPNVGQMRWNTTLGFQEVWNGSVWVPPGHVLQAVTGTIAAGSGTAVMLYGNSLPLSTAGNLIWTQSFTPISASSKLLIRFTLTVGNSVVSNRTVLAVFAGTTCTSAAMDTSSSLTNYPYNMSLLDSYSPGSTAAITFTARIGGVGAGTTFWNQNSGATLGGAAVTTYEISEVL